MQLKSLEIHSCSKNKCLINILLTWTAESLEKLFQLVIKKQPAAKCLKQNFVLWFLPVDTGSHLGGIRRNNEGTLVGRGKK